MKPNLNQQQNFNKLFVYPIQKQTISNKQMFNLVESEIDSKESTSKTPCFIGTPTSNSQIGSLNGTGAVKAEDLIRAMKGSNQDYHDTKRLLQLSSSNNSSSEKLHKGSKLLYSNAPVMSFGGDSN